MTESTAHTTQHTAGLSEIGQIRVTVIGAGNMGGPVVKTLLRSGVAAEHVAVVNSSEASSQRAADALGVTTRPMEEALRGADVVVLGVKPYQILDLLDSIRDQLSPSTIVISLAAGVTNAHIADHLPSNQPLVRAMPNTPIAVGEGAVGLMASPTLSAEQHSLVSRLFATAGVVVDMTEDQVHAFIGAAGSAPAFVFTVIEAMTDEAVRQGLKRDLAQKLVVQTVIGAGAMLKETRDHPAVARQAVTSPGGTTAHGNAAMERTGVRAGLAEAMRAAADFSRTMAGE